MSAAALSNWLWLLVDCISVCNRVKYYTLEGLRIIRVFNHGLGTSLMYLCDPHQRVTWVTHWDNRKKEDLELEEIYLLVQVLNVLNFLGNTSSQLMYLWMINLHFRVWIFWFGSSVGISWRYPCDIDIDQMRIWLSCTERWVRNPHEKSTWAQIIWRLLFPESKYTIKTAPPAELSCFQIPQKTCSGEGFEKSKIKRWFS